MSNIPPFYIGQKIEAIINHTDGDFKKGDRFIVKSLVKKPCCGRWTVDVGTPYDYINYSGYNCCGDCGGRYLAECNFYYHPKLFRPVQEQKFPLIEYKKVLEEVPVGAN